MSNDSKVTSLDQPAPKAVEAVRTDVKKLVGKSSGDSGLSGSVTRIKIFASTEEGGNHAVFVSHNGIAYLIPRDEVMDVPDELLEILNNAVTTITSPNRDGVGVITRDVPRFNYQVIR